MANKNEIHLTQASVDYAILPIEGTVLSTNGSPADPTALISLVTNLDKGVIGFKVPQGAYWVLEPEPNVLMKLYTTSGGSTQISPTDSIVLYSKSPSEARRSLGTKITNGVNYSEWWDLSKTLQKNPSYLSRLTLPVTDAITLYENYILIVAISTYQTSETLDWTLSKIDIPVNEYTAI